VDGKCPAFQKGNSSRCRLPLVRRFRL
jgi:hypothetical protein